MEHSRHRAYCQASEPDHGLKFCATRAEECIRFGIHLYRTTHETMFPSSSNGLLAIAYLFLAANSAPAPLNDPGITVSARLVAEARAPAPEPQFLGGLVGGLVGPVGTLTTTAVQALNSTLAQLLYPKPTSSPKTTNDVLNYLQKRYQNKDKTGYISNGIDYALNGILTTLTGAQGFRGATIAQGSQGINSFTNNNPAPPKTIYPRAATSDPKFSLSESALRSAIYIPATFKASNAPNPVLLVPGTGAFGGVTYEGNFAKILQANPSIGQPLWLNVPNALLMDAQLNAEYVTYAINYVNAITGKKVNVIAWSQGNVDTQWSLKYFPSTRTTAKQLISISPDFHGTVLANLIDIGTDVADIYPMAESILQQEYNSNFITQLRKTNGDSAYIPTTTFYSALFDEIVQPQADPNASAFINDARKVGVSNNEIQAVCGAAPAGIFGTHESLLFNGFVITLALQALTKGRAVQASEIDLTTACQSAVYPGLALVDVLETEALIPFAGINILEYIGAGRGSFDEPALKAYATAS